MDRKYIIVAVLLLAATLRLWGLERGDTINDEVFYAFRAIGPLDFDEAEEQTTPLEWNDPEIPWWTSLSFHDHPPLVFWTQYVFIKIFGENNFAFRLPSVLLGVASVFLLYLIGATMFSRRVGLLAALFLGVTLNHVYITRTGMQEAYVIFFLLFSSFLFLKSLRNDKYLIWLGVALGFGLLAKYTVFVALPVFLVLLLIERPKMFFNKNLWLSALLALIIFSPVIIYNIKLYQEVGHFDFQISHILGQKHDVWQVAPGKEIGTFSDRLNNFFPRLAGSNSWLFLLFSVVAFLSFFVGFLKSPKAVFLKYKFLVLWFFFLLLLILFIGPAFRFLTVFAPFFALSAAVFLSAIYPHTKFGVGVYGKWLSGRAWVSFALLGVFIAFEIFYSVNNQILYYPLGPSLWLSSRVRYENYNWGYNELESYLEKEFKGKMPAFTFKREYQFLEKLSDDALSAAKKNGAKLDPFLIAYGGNMDDGARLWILGRRFTYHGWPIIRIEDYFRFRHELGDDYFTSSGFKEFYFVLASNTVFPPEVTKHLSGADYDVLRTKRGDEVFRIYKWNN